MCAKFALTFDVVTEASAVNGDVARHGYVTRHKSIPQRTHLPKRPALFRLRDAADFLLDRSSSGPVEADCCPVSVQSPPRWFTYGGEFDREHNGHVRVSLHLPRTVTAASAVRVARLLGCYGLKCAKCGGSGVVPCHGAHTNCPACKATGHTL